jgi:hypothetical protein|tara:strand:+ start:607 stop:1188 length:582 start_codon:yes stop_codon:yes gene_type:complete
MSHRTDELEKLTGIRSTIREWRYHEFSRQSIGIILLSVFGLVAEPEFINFALACLMVFLGLSLRLYASGFVLKNKELSTTGPYAFVRHPLYTGNVLILIGISFATSLPWAIACSILFFWFYYPPAIEYEDRKLKSLFPDTWDAWSSQTPALIPTTIHDFNLSSWSWKKSLANNYEPVIVIYVLIWLIIIANRL